MFSAACNVRVHSLVATDKVTLKMQHSDAHVQNQYFMLCCLKASCALHTYVN